MIRSTLWFALVLGSVAASPIQAAEVTLAYKGVVTRSSGPLASHFAAGQSISVRYVVESSASDTQPSANSGVFFNGLRQLSVEVPAAGLAATSAPGTVQTFNDVGTPPSDQVFFYSYAMSSSSSLGGRSITGLEVDFIDYAAEMLSSDALPTTHLATVDSFVMLRTGTEYTFVNFVAEPDLPVATCASEGYTGTKLIWCQNICEDGYTGALLNAWTHRWIGRYRTLPSCAISPRN